MMKRMSMLAVLIILLFVPAIYAEDRALLVGVNEYQVPEVPHTPGCVEDVAAMKEFLTTRLNFSASSIKTLTNQDATAANIQQAFQQWLIDGTQPGDRIFFLYSGHGSQLCDDNGDEADGLDETIAPYDVNPWNGDNEIRDDKFNVFISQLSGRRAVMVFDSCHSGTISRGNTGERLLPSPVVFNVLHPNKNLSREEKQKLDCPKVSKDSNLKSRDLYVEKEFVKPQQLANLSGIIVISAAKDDQTAYPMVVNGQYRGALSYLFAEVQKDKILTLAELKDAITRKVSEYHNNHRLSKKGTFVLDGVQEPQFETISSVSLDNAPLFGNWEQNASVILNNPLSQIQVSLKLAGEQKIYHKEELLRYEVTTNSSGYLYLMVFSEGNVATCLFPNSSDLNNQTSSGKLTIPTNSTYTIPVQEPYGRDVVVAIVSKQKLNLGDKVDYTWSEVFERLNIKEIQTALVQAASRGQKPHANNTSLGAEDWQATSIVVETRE